MNSGWQVGDRAVVPDDGWGEPALVDVIGVKPGTVHIQRADGYISACSPEHLTRPSQDGAA